MLIQCDFDGTITEEDVSFALLGAYARGDWEGLLAQYREHIISVGEFNTRAFSMVRASEAELLRVARASIRLRPGLPELVAYCRQQGFRFTIVSNGLDFYIKAILGDIGLDDVEIYAATTRFNRSGLEVQYISPEGTPLVSEFKEAYSRYFLGQGYRIVYVGNGPSDISPAVMAHHVFARDGLLDYCRQLGVACLPFADLGDVLRGLERL